MQVDHIVPPSAFSKKRVNRKGQVISNTSYLARAMNSSFNTVAICPTCNLQKSDKMGVYTAKGAVAKTGELATRATQKAIGFGLFLLGRAVWGVGKLITLPLSKRSPLFIKLGYILLIIGIILYFRRR